MSEHTEPEIILSNNGYILGVKSLDNECQFYYLKYELNLAFDISSALPPVEISENEYTAIKLSSYLKSKVTPDRLIKKIAVSENSNDLEPSRKWFSGL